MRRLILALVFAAAAAGVAHAQLKVAVINSQKALLDTEEIKKAQADLEAKFKPRQEQMAKLEKELQDIQAQLQGGKLSQAAEQDLNVQGQRKQRDLQRLQQDLQEEVERERNEILQRAGTRMQQIVTKLANDKGLDLVVDAANTLFFKPTLELTMDAVTAYNQAYPVK
jgi:outer membrane protein